MTKHRKTCSPFECTHCGYIWYGFATDHRYVSDSTVLCHRCWNTLDIYLWKKYEDVFSAMQDAETDDNLQAVRIDAQSWIENKNNKPLPRSSERRFAANVPKWMRSAINAGMVITNSEDSYIVYGHGNQATAVEIANQATFSPYQLLTESKEKGQKS